MKRILTGVYCTVVFCMGSLHAEGIPLSERWYHELVVEELGNRIDKLAATVKEEQNAGAGNKALLAELQKQKELQAKAIVKALADYFLDQEISVDGEESQNRLNSFRNMLLLLRQVKERPDVALIQQMRDEIGNYSQTALTKKEAPAVGGDSLISEMENSLDLSPDFLQKKHPEKKHVTAHKTKKGAALHDLNNQEENSLLEDIENEIADGDFLPLSNNSAIE